MIINKQGFGSGLVTPCLKALVRCPYGLCSFVFPGFSMVFGATFAQWGSGVLCFFLACSMVFMSLAMTWYSANATDSRFFRTLVQEVFEVIQGIPVKFTTNRWLKKPFPVMGGLLLSTFGGVHNHGGYPNSRTVFVRGKIPICNGWWRLGYPHDETETPIGQPHEYMFHGESHGSDSHHQWHLPSSCLCMTSSTNCPKSSPGNQKDFKHRVNQLYMAMFKRLVHQVCRINAWISKTSKDFVTFQADHWNEKNCQCGFNMVLPSTVKIALKHIGDFAVHKIYEISKTTKPLGLHLPSTHLHDVWMPHGKSQLWGFHSHGSTPITWWFLLNHI